jgi:AAA family ATP:ADP antiporter
MAFLSIEEEERIRAKSVIDSIGSRLGKSGASCLYQFLLIAFGSTSGHISIIGISSICMIGISILATKQLGRNLSEITTVSSSEEVLA